MLSIIGIYGFLFIWGFNEDKVYLNKLNANAKKKRFKNNWTKFSPEEIDFLDIQLGKVKNKIKKIGYFKSFILALKVNYLKPIYIFDSVFSSIFLNFLQI